VTTKRPRILLDVDGVLADFVSSYLELVYQETGNRHTHEQVTQFDMKRALGLTDIDAAHVAAQIQREGFCSAIEPLPGAVDAVRRLQAISDVYIITSPWNSCPTWTHEREKWLANHFAIPHAHVLHGSAKHLVVGDVLVDDRWDTCVKWRDEHPSKTVVMWESPWNRTCEWSGWLTNDWDQLIRLVEALP
jgi:5'(3')-deoxyribonucleotidase